MKSTSYPPRLVTTVGRAVTLARGTHTTVITNVVATLSLAQYVFDSYHELHGLTSQYVFGCYHVSGDRRLLPDASVRSFAPVNLVGPRKSFRRPSFLIDRTDGELFPVRVLPVSSQPFRVNVFRLMIALERRTAVSIQRSTDQRNIPAKLASVLN